MAYVTKDDFVCKCQGYGMNEQDHPSPKNSQ